MKLNRLGYLIKEGFLSIFTHGFMSFACVMVIVACLLIMGSFALVALNVNHIIGGLEDQVSLLCFVPCPLMVFSTESSQREITAYN